MINEKLNKYILDLINENKTEINNIKGKILWTNPNPTSSFERQDITLNSSDYDMLEIFYVEENANGSLTINSVRTLKGFNTTLPFFKQTDAESLTGFVGNRKIYYTNDTTLSVQNATGYWFRTYSQMFTYNDSAVPVKIIGYKTGLFS